MQVRRSALVAHPAEHLYALIERVEDYPKFLPWCSATTLLARDADTVSARIEIAWRGVRFDFVTINQKRFPSWMSIRLERGPFKRFEGEWQLTPLAEWGCRVEFALVYEFAAGVLGKLAAPVFEHVTNTLVDAFVRRADEVVFTRPPLAPPAPPAAEPQPPLAEPTAPSAAAPGATLAPIATPALPAAPAAAPPPPPSPPSLQE